MKENKVFSLSFVQLGRLSCEFGSFVLFEEFGVHTLEFRYDIIVIEQLLECCVGIADHIIDLSRMVSEL